MRIWFKGNRKIYLTLIIVAASATILWSIDMLSDKPPHESIENSRHLISKARREQAEKYASRELIEAEKSWGKAIDEWKKQNEKAMAFRDFSKVNKLSHDAAQKAKSAIDKAKKTRKSLAEELSESLKQLKIDADLVDNLSQKLPVNHKIREKLTPEKLQLSEAQELFNRQEYLHSQKIIVSIKPKIEHLKKQTIEIVKEYFSYFNTWKSQQEEMIKHSKENQCVALVVDKFSRICLVYKSGKLIHEFEAELGANWIGFKRYKGDMATPEGLYHITKRKTGKSTKYHKALLINYPNDDDKKRFVEAKAKKQIPARADIGGLIEIHGHGGRGADWTEGCVALENKDMDKLFSLCPEGTRLAIVGSLKPFSEVTGLE